MAQILDPIPSDGSNAILCCYVNSTSKIQVVRVTNIPNWYFERVVFPGQRLMFETAIESQLEIHSGSMASSILEDTIPCTRLEIAQPESDMAVSPVQSSSPLEVATESSPVLSTMQPVHANG
ncbi:MAG: DUF1830 domain-containing protein [Cyanobacteria bacterium J06649_11]